LKLSFDWLSEYVDLSGVSPNQVADKLTMGAFEVEEVTKFGSDINGPLVVGEIIEINPHPNADKIRLTKIKIDEKSEARQIVCGASNIVVGQKIPVALPGAKVLNRHDGSELHIKESQIRGVTSYGMLCSPPELGILDAAEASEGILILDKETKLGTNVIELLGLKTDWILHVEPRSNRGDAMSVIGLAREVAALIERPLKEPLWELGTSNSFGEKWQVEIQNNDDCPFFSLRLIDGVKIGPSPNEIARRLQAVGMRPVNNIVDITNYVLYELGQPMHAYDSKVLSGEKLTVRRAKEKEKLHTLDDKERALSSEVLVIADSKEVVGIAGVMGGKSSEIGNATTSLALEAAMFNPARVRRSGRLLGITSESSLRFERGVDVAGVEQASNRATYLIAKYAQGKLGKLIISGSNKTEKKNISLRLSEFKRLADINIESNTVNKLLSPLGFSCRENSDKTLAIDIPSFRQRDVSREIDIVEEVLRLWGYDKVPVSMPSPTMAAQPVDNLINQVVHSLSAQGLNETWITSLVSFDDLTCNNLIPVNKQSLVSVLNPLSAEHQVLRISLIPGLIKAVVYNQNQSQSDIWLFEIGRIYQAKNKQDKNLNAIKVKDTGTNEDLYVAGIISGNCPQMNGINWTQSDSSSNNDSDKFFFTKGIIENLFSNLHISTDSLRYEQISENTYYHPGKSAQVFFLDKAGKTKSLGYFGEIHPAIAQVYGLKNAAFAFELNLEIIKTLRPSPTLLEIASTPVSVRDLSVDVTNSINQISVKQIIQSSSELLINVELVSLFPLSDNKKSLTYRLYFQDKKATLTAEQVEKQMTKIRNSLTSELSATFRM
jgi:phenylalanyl-tRNA synthetase beta chain